MALDVRPIVAAISSHVAAGGHCSRVTGHELKGPSEVAGMTAAVWFSAVTPTGRNSGLATTDALVTFMVRFYSPWTSDPEDEIDPRMTDAMQDLMGRLDGDFTLGGAVDFVDLLGMTGQGLQATAGFVELSRAMQRVIDVSVPCVVHDVWTQAR